MEIDDFLVAEIPELVIGLVAPVGTEKSIVVNELTDRLASFGYTPTLIKLSSFLEEIELGIELVDSPEYERVRSHMAAGTKLRETMKAGDALALWAITDIATSRPPEDQFVEKRAYILDSLKHPAEVATLRRVYGNGFFLVAIYSPEIRRFEFLARNRGITEEQAKSLIRVDEDEDSVSELGQRTRDTFHLSDAFVSLINPEEAQAQITRVLDLIFGSPFITPTKDEYAMFHAFTAALRSADLSRQVGAVILSADGELIAVGANDVPCFGGGLYWAGDDDHRDHDWGVDSNAKRRDQILVDIASVVKTLSPDAKNKDDREIIAAVKSGLSHSLVMDITEFGRPVHAEMEAIISCARTGISARNGTLYCTTLPCHNCAKHVVAAGIKRVVYVEPYPKSKAKELHSDSIHFEDDSCDLKKVNFVPFVGVGSRRFIDLFSMGLSAGYPMKRKIKNSGEKIDWKRSDAKVRVPMLHSSYLERENAIASFLSQYQKGENDDRKRE